MKGILYTLIVISFVCGSAFKICAQTIPIKDLRVPGEFLLIDRSTAGYRAGYIRVTRRNAKADSTIALMEDGNVYDLHCYRIFHDKLWDFSMSFPYQEDFDQVIIRWWSNNVLSTQFVNCSTNGMSKQVGFAFNNGRLDGFVSTILK